MGNFEDFLPTLFKLYGHKLPLGDALIKAQAVKDMVGNMGTG